MNYCFLDLETTGLDNKKDSILEVSFLICDENGKEFDRFDEVFIPDKSPLTSFITHITGIGEKEIKEKGLNFQNEKSAIIEKIGECVIVGHNIDFDIQFLIENGIPLENNPRIDTHELARITLINEESYSLEILSEKYEFTHSQAHRAMSDVEASKELFDFLKKKIEELPREFLDLINPILEKKTDWFGKKFFLEAKGGSTPLPEKKSISSPKGNISNEIESLLSSLSPNHSLFVRQGDSFTCEDCMYGFVEKLKKNKRSVLIISPKLDFFESVKKFPTPEVLLDPLKLKHFSEKEKLNNQECAFYVQCSFRHFLGLRGVHDFNLFAGQRELWNQVCITDPNHDVFQKIIVERTSENVLAISPAAFFRFRNLELFQERILLIDESEIFAEKLLFAPAKEYSLFEYLNSPDSQISGAAHFFVAGFCREVIEPRLQRGLSGFPEKILIEKNESFPLFAEKLKEFGDDPNITALTDILLNKDPSLTRWIRYFPETGNLILGSWNPNVWREIKESLSAWEKVFFYRHKLEEGKAFFRIFIGSVEGVIHEEKNLLLNKTLEVPPNLVSSNSPEFNSFCADTITSLAKENVDEKNFLAVNFSSLETLKKVYSEIFDSLLEEGISLLGEKATGGDGKLLQHLQGEGKKVLFMQKLVHPNFQNLPFSHLVVQKFPFSPPHPLLEEIEQVMKISGQSFWDCWIIPTVTANLSRRISIFPKAGKVIWLDPKENSDWGKGILKSLFS